MLYEHGRLPIYMFPRAEVRTDLLLPSEHQTESANKGPARWSDLRLGERLVAAAAWEYPAPPPGAPPLAGLIAFRWDALEEWFEEDEPAIVHARDPYHRVDVLDTSRHVRISLDDKLLATSNRGRVIFETALPPRWYVPRQDVRAELLDSETRTGCAYKGFASYYSSDRRPNRARRRLDLRSAAPRGRAYRRDGGVLQRTRRHRARRRAAGSSAHSMVAALAGTAIGGAARRVGLSTVEIPTSELHHRHTVAADGGRRAI
jgi:uncharacterized protein (DUF427 family)